MWVKREIYNEPVTDNPDPQTEATQGRHKRQKQNKHSGLNHFILLTNPLFYEIMIRYLPPLQGQYCTHQHAL